MSGKFSRLAAINALADSKGARPAFVEVKPTEIFGSNVFSDAVMQARLPREVYLSLKKTIELAEPLDPSIADIVANAMKDWAIEHGATHFSHVFYPLNGLTAEKHDAFLVPDGKGGAIVEFSGKLLIRGEPDASSLPSGGLRSTFEARGYTAWDVTSPAYIFESANCRTLCIPTAFMAWTGEALDKKTPLLRSNQVLNRQAQRVLRLFGKETSQPVIGMAGAEQEYFLIDRKLVYARPDMVTCGRTLFGAKPAKGQEFDDQYFGVIPERVLAFMAEAEQELYRLGVPIKTRHNETAPHQYEIAPLYEAGNLATDHNQLTMMVMRAVAKRHGMVCVLHEKPFLGINGSGKHLNYSVGNAELGSLFDPGETPAENAQFLLFCAARIRAVHKHGALLRATVASASNDHRLGAHEAPPAIMSIFLGEHLTEVFESLSTGKKKSRNTQHYMHAGVGTLPPLPLDPGDRNRTSPLAFTGNRFEFRAVGASASIAGPQVALNTLMADSLDYIATELEAAVKKDPAKLNDAVQALLVRIMKEHGKVIFNGDGYSEEWQKEAAKRGLLNLRTMPEAMPQFTEPEIIEIFERYGVLLEEELRSRQEIYLEHYCKTIKTEARTMLRMARTIIFPAAAR